MSDMGDLITVTGNVGTVPELKHTSAGVAITTFRLGRGLRRFDRDAGAWSDAGTNWYTVSVFRALADHAFASLRKGDRVIVTGRLRVRDWENSTSRGTAVEIDAEAIGHDLRWGTTTFVKDTRTSSHQAAANAAPSTPEDAWAAPGLDVAAPEQDAHPSVGAPRPLVLAGSSDDRATGETDADVPF